MKRLALLLGVLVMAWSVQASADWLKGCQTGRETFVTSLSGTGKIACHIPDPTQGAVIDPHVLQVTDCDNVDVFYYPDADGDGADSAGTVDIYTCPSTVFTITVEATLEAACQPLDGGTQLTAVNTEAMGIGAGFLWFDVEGIDDDAELQAVCNVGP